jgi:hypothetical protein
LIKSSNQVMQQSIFLQIQFTIARQKGIIKLDSTIGDITFYKSKDGYPAKEKGGMPADRIANDLNFHTRRRGWLQRSNAINEGAGTSSV